MSSKQRRLSAIFDAALGSPGRGHGSANRAGGQWWVRQLDRGLFDEFAPVVSDRAGSIHLSGLTCDMTLIHLSGLTCDMTFGNFHAWVVKYSTSR